MGAYVIYAYMKRRELFPDNHKISVSRIESWFTRIAKMTIKTDFDAVLAAYKSISNEDIIKSNPRCSELRVPLTQDFINDLNAALKDRPNFSRKLLLKRPDTPKGFSSAKFSSILNGKVKTISTGHKKFLEDTLL